MGHASTPNYLIRVRGLLGDAIIAAFPELIAHHRGHDTVLAGGLPDQAALYGVLARIEGLGLELIEIRQVEPDTSTMR